MAADEMTITEIAELQAFIRKIGRISGLIRQQVEVHGQLVLKKDEGLAIADLLEACMASVELQMKFVRDMMEAELKAGKIGGEL